MNPQSWPPVLGVAIGIKKSIAVESKGLEGKQALSLPPGPEEQRTLSNISGIHWTDKRRGQCGGLKCNGINWCILEGFLPALWTKLTGFLYSKPPPRGMAYALHFWAATLPMPPVHPLFCWDPQRNLSPLDGFHNFLRMPSISSNKKNT